MLNKDWKHSLMMNWMVKEIEKRWDDRESTIHLVVEKEYNDYGSRGFVDIYHKHWGWGRFTREAPFIRLIQIDLYEIKPMLLDLGEGIRQLNKAKAALVTTPPEQYLLRLVILAISENIEIVTKKWDLLAHVDERFCIDFLNPILNKCELVFPSLQEFPLDVVDPIKFDLEDLKKNNKIKETSVLLLLNKPA